MVLDMSDNVKNTNNKQGFAGLVDLASDLSGESSTSYSPTTKDKTTEPKESPATAHVSSSREQQASPHNASNVHPSSGRPRSYISQVCYTVIGLVLVVVFFNKYSTTGSKSSSDLISKQNQSNSSATPMAQSKSGTSTQYLSSEKPPMTSGLLFNIYQIRFCLIEDVRISAIRAIVRDYNVDIDRFNNLVADYNARCSNYRYHKRDFSSAQQEVSTRRQEIYRDAQTSWINGR